jgi:hypothetical protein
MQVQFQYRLIFTILNKSTKSSKRQTMKYLSTILILIIIGLLNCPAQENATQGIYFSKKRYDPKPLPTFENTRNKLPSPVFEEDKTFVNAYWKAWAIAFRNMYEPAPGSGFVSQFVDAAFSHSIFLWDMSFIIMFARYGTPYVPAISGLDNFYIKQHLNGEICRQITRATGEDDPRWTNFENKPLFSRYGISHYRPRIEMPVVYMGREIPEPNPNLTLDGLNHPILAWAEMESFRITGDSARLEMVFQPLEMYYQALQMYLRQGNGLYVTDWAQMDNSQRNIYLMNGGTAVDISSEMVLFARNLSDMASVLGKADKFNYYTEQADELSAIINQKMWHEEDGFYYDLTLTEQPIPIKTIGGFWPLIGQVADEKKVKPLIAQLNNPNTFNRKHRVPTLAADEKEYDPAGGYWNGAVWAPTVTMVVRGLENYGYHDLAADIALNHLNNVVKVFKNTGTIWENYAADSIVHGRPARDEFVGWSGIAPISFFIEYAIGIKANGPEKYIDWTIRSDEKVGIKKFWFGGITADFICHPETNGKRKVEISGDGNFSVTILNNDKEYKVKVIRNQKAVIWL